jgi:putative protease
MKNMKKRPEILAPVGNETMLAAAIQAGADAVYFGVKTLNMRATAGNFELSQLKKITKHCHAAGLKAFLTLNVIVYDDEMEKLSRVIREAKEANVDAIIAWDMAVVTESIKQGMEVHLSTQASVSNFPALRHFAGLGVKRVVLARECTLEQVRAIKDNIIKSGLDVQIEAFVHGAMCVSISGRCFMSQFQFCKSANRGDCLQPCRREYDIVDQATGFKLTMGDDYVLSPKDLCTIEFVDKLIEAGIDSMKIEGRAKTPEYVHTVVSAYRRAVDAYAEGIYSPELASGLRTELDATFNRGFSDGFYMGRPIDDFTDEYGPKENVAKQYVGRVRNYYKRVGVVEIAVESNPIGMGEMLMIQGPTTGVVEGKVESMQIEHVETTIARKGQSVAVKFAMRVRPGDRVFLLSPGGKDKEAPLKRSI